MTRSRGCARSSLDVAGAAGARARIAAICGLLSVVTFNLGWVAGDLAQRPAFSPRRDDISDLGALTARAPWLYDQLAANLSGLLVATLGVGLWSAVRPSRLGRAGAAALVVAGLGTFLDGLFRLDCQRIDAGCHNDSWHAHAHKIESSVTVTATLVALVVLAVAFRRDGRWRGAWPVTAGALPALFAANLAFSGLGDGAATRAGTVVLFLAFGAIAWHLRRVAAATAGSR